MVFFRPSSSWIFGSQARICRASVVSGFLCRGSSEGNGSNVSFDAEPVIQTIVETAGGYLFITSVSEGSTLAVFASTECDIGMIGYEMTLLVTRVGQLLVPGTRGPETAAR